MLLLGASTLFPWLAFITAVDYFKATFGQLIVLRAQYQTQSWTPQTRKAVAKQRRKQNHPLG